MTHRENNQPKHRSKWPYLLGGLAALCLIGAVAAYLWLFADLPDPASMRQVQARETTKILDREGRVLYEWLDNVEGKHTYVTLDRIPLALQQATVATEDATFYRNPGVDLGGILRAAYYNLRYGEITSGASTITQQTARIILLPEERWERTWRRKLREAFLAWRISRLFSKGEVLELYLNYSYYGNYAYGVEAAAEAYFAKRADELDLAEAALLTGLLQAPVHYNPLTNMQGAKERQDVVLGLMVEAGYISQEEADLALGEALRFAARPFAINAPHFVMMVRQQLEEWYGVEEVARGGWRVVTTLDLDMQARRRDRPLPPATALRPRLRWHGPQCAQRRRRGAGPSDGRGAGHGGQPRLFRCRHRRRGERRAGPAAAGVVAEALHLCRRDGKRLDRRAGHLGHRDAYRRTRPADVQPGQL